MQGGIFSGAHPYVRYLSDLWMWCADVRVGGAAAQGMGKT